MALSMSSSKLLLGLGSKGVESEPWRRRALDTAGRGAPSPPPPMRPSIWTICYNPLKPPVFQCGVGHVICSSCHGNLLDTRRCHMCNRDGGYRRCMAVEHILNSIMVSCPNAAYGCAAKTAYHDSDGHAGGCPHAPCFCPEPGCGFAGATAALLAQFTDTHGWPATMMWHRRAVGIPLQEGKQVLSLLDADGRGRHLFLLNIAPAGEAGLVGTVLAVEAAAAAAHGHGDAPRFECQVSFDRRGTGWRQSSTFGVRITNLSDGLPVDCFAFVAPKVNPPPAAATSVSVTLFDISTGYFFSSVVAV